MTALEHAEELRKRAIDLLLEERAAIVEKLKQIGYGDEQKSPAIRRGRPKRTTPAQDPEQPVSHSDTTQSALPLPHSELA